MIDKDIDTVVRKIIESKESNYKIAKETGITESTIGNYKNGRTKPTKANTKILLEYFSNLEAKNLKTLETNNHEINLIEYRKLNNITQKELADKVGVSLRTIQYWEKGIKDITHINMEKLKKVLGDDLIVQNGSPIGLKINEAVIIKPGITYVPVVSQYAYAGYLGSFDDFGYMSSLPTQPVFIENELMGKYLFFEVRGDSMNDGTDASIKEGDLLLSREINKDYWTYKLYTKGWNYVIVHKIEGVLIKRIVEHDVAKGVIKIHSLNPLFQDVEISLNDVSQLFNVVQIQRKV